MKITMGFGIVSGLALAGCLAAAADEPSSVEEGQTQSSRTAEVTPIWIHTDEGAGLVLYREGANGPWQTPTLLKAGTYEGHVSGPYTVMVVCPFEGTASTGLSSQTLDDNHMTWIGCLFQQPPNFLSGSMVQPGRVTAGDSGQSSTQANWSFDLEVYPGTHDVVANSAERIAVQRSVVVTGDRTVPTIDLVSQGFAFLPAQVTVTNPLPGDTMRAQTYLQTLRTFAILGSRPLPALIVPPQAMLPGDQQSTSYRASNVDGNANITRFLRRAPSPGAQQPPVTFGSHFTGLSVGPDGNGDLRASWTALHSDVTYFTASDFLGNFFDHAVSKSYLDATGGHGITLGTQAPGFLPEWRLDLSAYNYVINAQYGAVDTTGLTSYLRDEDVFANAAAAGRDGKARELEQQKARAELRHRVQPDGFVKKMPER